MMVLMPKRIFLPREFGGTYIRRTFANARQTIKKRGYQRQTRGTERGINRTQRTKNLASMRSSWNDWVPDYTYKNQCDALTNHRHKSTTLGTSRANISGKKSINSAWEVRWQYHALAALRLNQIVVAEHNLTDFI